MKIGLYVNLKRDIDGRYSKYFIQLMKKRGIEYRIIEANDEVFLDEKFYTRDEVLDFADFMAVFGGDGTSGGPILSPNVKAFIVNSICPHSLNTRPMVISSRSKVTLRSKLTDSDGGIIIVDGKVVDELHSYEEFNIERANANVRFLRIEETNFYNRLLDKMNTWTN